MMALASLVNMSVLVKENNKIIKSLTLGKAFLVVNDTICDWTGHIVSCRSFAKNYI